MPSEPDDKKPRGSEPAGFLLAGGSPVYRAYSAAEAEGFCLRLAISLSTADSTTVPL